MRASRCEGREWCPPRIGRGVPSWTWPGGLAHSFPAELPSPSRKASLLGECLIGDQAIGEANPSTHQPQL